MAYEAESALGMTTTDAKVKALTDVPTGGEKAARKKKGLEFYEKILATKEYRRKLSTNWSVNIDYRRQKPFATQSDDDQIAVPTDWSMTKSKVAALFSQVPKVMVSHPPNTAQAGPWLAIYETKLNDVLVGSGIETVMDEIMPDVINAAGIGVALVCYETLTETKQMPLADKLAGGPEGIKPIPQVLDRRYVLQRISPSDFLWPLEFIGSNFDDAPWVGRSGRMTWEEAKRRFNLKEEQKNDFVGDERTYQDKLSYDIEKDRACTDYKVSFDEIFYKEFQYEAEATSYSAYHHMIFLAGKTEPVLDEPWKGQRYDPQTNELIGCMRAPIRVLTLTYISDDAIPPSDSAIARTQVNENNKIRTQWLKQLERSIPVRWFDVNRIDPTIQFSLMRGTWMNMIPIQGDGSRVIGEVAKAAIPQDNFTINEIIKNDIYQAWSLGPNQMGSGEGIETKGESTEIASNFQTRTGRERARVASFVVGLAQVLGGLICLNEEPGTFGEGFQPAFSRSLSFSVVADSTVLVDANQRLERMNKFLDTYAKTGHVVLEPVLREIAILSGLDPNTVIKAPDPQSPPPPNVSLRISGAEDLMNPLVLATFLNNGQPPTLEGIEQAKQMIQAAVLLPVPPSPPPQPPPQDPNAPPGPPPPPTPVGEAYPEATILPTISKRSGDNEGGVQ